MPRAATKEAAEPALDLDMKDVTPKKGDDKSADQKPAKPAAAKPKNAVAVRDAKATVPLNMLAVLANAASDPKCEPAKMRELYAIHKMMSEDQAKVDFIRDFSALQTENLHINARGKIVIPGKEGRAGQSTPYARFNDINKAIKPLLRKHHFTLSFETEPSTDSSRIIVKGRLAHDNGHERVTAFPLPADVGGSKSNVQAWASSMSYGKRYCTIALLNLTSEAMDDDDTDGNAAPAKTVAGATSKQVVQDEGFPDAKPKGLTIQQSTALVQLIKTSGIALERFLDRYKIKAVIDLDPALLSEAEKACKDYAAAAASKKTK